MRSTTDYRHTLDPCIESRRYSPVNGLDMHVLQAGDPGNPLILLLHGFPELSYSWRKVMPALAARGYFVVAPDQRGYGQTTGSDNRFDGDFASFRFFNLVRDALGLIHALNHQQVALLVGHDFGSPLAACCALLRPDVFRALVMMSAPFAGVPPIFDGEMQADEAARQSIDHRALAALPQSRKHYQWYYSERHANDNMLRCHQGVHDFLRAYYHYKSADWDKNKPQRLPNWSAQSFASMPEYYVMRAELGMSETAAAAMPSVAQIENCQWLTDDELAVYSPQLVSMRDQWY